MDRVLSRLCPTPIVDERHLRASNRRQESFLRVLEGQGGVKERVVDDVEWFRGSKKLELRQGHGMPHLLWRASWW